MVNFQKWLMLEEIKDIRLIFSNVLEILKNSKEDLYVNFSSMPKDLMTASLKPNHHDPIGIYGFLKKYMLEKDNSNDGFWSLPYITIFKLKNNSKVLNLSKLSNEEALHLLEIMGIKDWINKPYFREMRGTKGGFVLWHTMEKYIATEKLHKNAAWNKLFEKAGRFDAVLDEGDGIIHFAEPAQICVLKPSAIEVVKKISVPLNDYIGQIWSALFKIAENIGKKYFAKYKIISSKSGKTGFYSGLSSGIRTDDVLPKHSLGRYRNFYLKIMSEEKEKPYLIGIEYDIPNAVFYSYFSDQNKNNIQLIKTPIAYTGVNYTHERGMVIPEKIEWDKIEKELSQAIDAKTPIHGTSDIHETNMNLHNSILNLMKLNKPKTIPNINDGVVQSYSQEKIENKKFNMWLKTSLSKHWQTKEEVIGVYFIVKMWDIFDKRFKQLFTANLEYNSKDKTFTPEKAIEDMKIKINQLVEILNTRENKYMYSDEIEGLKLIIKNIL